MANFEIPSEKKEFRCNHCNGKILIPRNLPPTTGPCPHCSGVITSPGPDAPEPVAVMPPPAPKEPEVPQLSALRTPPATPAAVPTPPVQVPSVQAPPPVQPPAVKESVPVQAHPAPPPTPVQPPPAADPMDTPPPAEATAKPVESPHTQDPSHGNKRKHKAAPVAKERPQKSGLIPVLLVLLLLILGGGAAVYFVANEMGRNVPPPALTATAGDPALKEAAYIRVGWQKEAYQLLRDYMAASTSKEKLPYILNGDALGTRLEDFYGGGVINDSDTPADAFSIYELSEEDRKRGLFMMIYDQPPQFEMKEFFRPLASLEVQYGIDEADLLLSTLARVGNFAMEPLRVHAFFKRTQSGLKLDWEVFAQTKYRTFQNFVELPETGQTGTFRVFIVEDVPDKGKLEAGTRTYRLADPANTGDTARVNVKVDSETGRALSLINWRGTKESRPITRTATVELKWTGENASPELEINRFICWEFLGLGGQDTPATASTK